MLRLSFYSLYLPFLTSKSVAFPYNLVPVSIYSRGRQALHAGQYLRQPGVEQTRICAEPSEGSIMTTQQKQKGIQSSLREGKETQLIILQTGLAFLVVFLKLHSHITGSI